MVFIQLTYNSKFSSYLGTMPKETSFKQNVERICRFATRGSQVSSKLPLLETNSMQ